MNGITLDPYNPSMTPEDKEKTVMTNFANIQKSMGLSGPNLLASKTTNSVFTTTSGSYVNIQFFDTAIQCSGGIISIEASFSTAITVSAAGYGSIALFVDGAQVQNKANWSPGGGGVFILPFVYKKALGTGPHKIEFKYKVAGGGTFNINSPASAFENGTSELFVTEYL